MSSRLRVIEDYGPIGKGASAAHTCLAENGIEYLIKGPAFASGHPYVAVNELIAVQLADLLGLPVLDHRIVEMNGHLFFASHYMQPGTFYQQTDQALFDQCENRERVYDLVALD